jgi:MFS family permease
LVSRIPVVQHQLHLNSAQLGIALRGTPLGQVIAMPLIPGVVQRWSSATAARWSATTTALSVVLIGLARNLGELTACLVLLGLALGALERA